LVRYIHLNPLAAGMAGSLDELDCYLWSGHAVLMGRQDQSRNVPQSTPRR
jgi:hypothetical protein